MRSEVSALIESTRTPQVPSNKGSLVVVNLGFSKGLLGGLGGFRGLCEGVLAATGFGVLGSGLHEMASVLPIGMLEDVPEP